MNKPDVCTEEMLSFLDENHAKNHLGGLLLENFTHLTINEAKEVLAYWCTINTKPLYDELP